MHKFKVGDFIKHSFSPIDNSIHLIKDLEFRGGYVTNILAPGHDDSIEADIYFISAPFYKKASDKDIMRILSEELKNQLVLNYSEEI
jgi:hypothetical protein